ncbi:hypothetical protein LDL59_10475 [Kaistella anthropi]|nr:hypothetical protein [Kaistella anthropi]
MNPIFQDENAQIVDKNSASYFVIRDNKLYLYPIQKMPRKSKFQRKIVEVFSFQKGIIHKTFKTNI